MSDQILFPLGLIHSPDFKIDNQKITVKKDIIILVIASFGFDLYIDNKYVFSFRSQEITYKYWNMPVNEWINEPIKDNFDPNDSIRKPLFNLIGYNLPKVNLILKNILQEIINLIFHFSDWLAKKELLIKKLPQPIYEEILDQMDWFTVKIAS